jgi:hypothetical protein
MERSIAKTNIEEFISAMPGGAGEMIFVQGLNGESGKFGTRNDDNADGSNNLIWE